jgi:hypothetical protein
MIINQEAIANLPLFICLLSKDSHRQADFSLLKISLPPGQKPMEDFYMTVPRVMGCRLSKKEQPFV